MATAPYTSYLANADVPIGQSLLSVGRGTQKQENSYRKEKLSGITKQKRL